MEAVGPVLENQRTQTQHRKRGQLSPALTRKCPVCVGQLPELELCVEHRKGESGERGRFGHVSPGQNLARQKNSEAA